MEVLATAHGPQLLGRSRSTSRENPSQGSATSRKAPPTFPSADVKDAAGPAVPSCSAAETPGRDTRALLDGSLKAIVTRSLESFMVAKQGVQVEGNERSTGWPLLEMLAKNLSEEVLRQKKVETLRIPLTLSTCRPGENDLGHVTSPKLTAEGLLSIQARSEKAHGNISRMSHSVNTHAPQENRSPAANGVERQISDDFMISTLPAGTVAPTPRTANEVSSEAHSLIPPRASTARSSGSPARGTGAAVATRSMEAPEPSLMEFGHCRRAPMIQVRGAASSIPSTVEPRRHIQGLPLYHLLCPSSFDLECVIRQAERECPSAASIVLLIEPPPVLSELSAAAPTSMADSVFSVELIFTNGTPYFADVTEEALSLIKKDSALAVSLVPSKTSCSSSQQGSQVASVRTKNDSMEDVSSDCDTVAQTEGKAGGMNQVIHSLPNFFRVGNGGVSFVEQAVQRSFRAVFGAGVQTLPEVVSGLVSEKPLAVAYLPRLQSDYLAVFDSIDSAVGTLQGSSAPLSPVIFASYNVMQSTTTLSRVVASMLPLEEQRRMAAAAETRERQWKVIRAHNLRANKQYWREVQRRREARDLHRKQTSSRTTEPSDAAADVEQGDLAASRNGRKAAATMPLPSLARGPPAAAASAASHDTDSTPSEGVLKPAKASTLLRATNRKAATISSRAAAPAAFTGTRRSVRRQSEDLAYVEMVRHSLNAAAVHIQRRFREHWRRQQQQQQQQQQHGRGAKAHTEAASGMPTGRGQLSPGDDSNSPCKKPTLAVPGLPVLLNYCLHQLHLAHRGLFTASRDDAPAQAAIPPPTVYSVWRPTRKHIAPKPHGDGDPLDVSSDEEGWEEVEVWVPDPALTHRPLTFDVLLRTKQCDILSRNESFAHGMELQRLHAGVSVLQRRAYTMIKAQCLNVLHNAFLELYHRGRLPADITTFSRYIECFHSHLPEWFSTAHFISMEAAPFSDFVLRDAEPLDPLRERLLLCAVDDPMPFRHYARKPQKNSIGESAPEVSGGTNTDGSEKVGNSSPPGIWTPPVLKSLCKRIYVTRSFLDVREWRDALQFLVATVPRVAWMSLCPNPGVYIHGVPHTAVALEDRELLPATAYPVPLPLARAPGGKKSTKDDSATVTNREMRQGGLVHASTGSPLRHVLMGSTRCKSAQKVVQSPLRTAKGMSRGGSVESTSGYSPEVSAQRREMEGLSSPLLSSQFGASLIQQENSLCERVQCALAADASITCYARRHDKKCDHPPGHGGANLSTNPAPRFPFTRKALYSVVQVPLRLPLGVSSGNDQDGGQGTSNEGNRFHHGSLSFTGGRPSTRSGRRRGDRRSLSTSLSLELQDHSGLLGDPHKPATRPTELRNLVERLRSPSLHRVGRSPSQSLVGSSEPSWRRTSQLQQQLSRMSLPGSHAPPSPSDVGRVNRNGSGVLEIGSESPVKDSSSLHLGSCKTSPFDNLEPEALTVKTPHRTLAELRELLPLGINIVYERCWMVNTGGHMWRMSLDALLRRMVALLRSEFVCVFAQSDADYHFYALTGALVAVLGDRRTPAMAEMSGTIAADFSLHRESSVEVLYVEPGMDPTSPAGEGPEQLSSSDRTVLRFLDEFYDLLRLPWSEKTTRLSAQSRGNVSPSKLDQTQQTRSPVGRDVSTSDASLDGGPVPLLKPSVMAIAQHCGDESIFFLRTIAEGIQDLEKEAHRIPKATEAPPAQAGVPQVQDPQVERRRQVTSLVRKVEQHCYLVLLVLFFSSHAVQEVMDRDDEGAALPSFTAFVESIDGVLEWMHNIDPWKLRQSCAPDPYHVRYTNGLRRWDDETSYMYRCR